MKNLIDSSFDRLCKGKGNDWNIGNAIWRNADDGAAGTDGGFPAAPTSDEKQGVWQSTLAHGGRTGADSGAVSAAVHRRLPTDGRDAGRVLEPDILHTL